MKKILKYSLIIIGIIIFINSFAFTFKVCPPKGPWPMPPWCEGMQIREGKAANVEFYVSIPYNYPKGDVYLNIDGKDSIKMNKVGRLSYKANSNAKGQEELHYYYSGNSWKSKDFTTKVLTSNHKTFDGVSKNFKPNWNFQFTIDMSDTWGRNYNFAMIENTRNNIESSFARVARLGASEVGARDFFWATYDGKGKADVNISDLNYVLEGDIFSNDFRDEEQTQEDLDKLASVAKSHGMDMLWRSNLAFNNIGDYIGKDITKEASEDFARIDAPKSVEYVNKFFKEWERILLYKTDMLNKAGYNSMIITPGWHNPTFQPYEELANQKWKELLKKVKAKFNGKVGVDISLYAFLNPQSTFEDYAKYDYYKDADFVQIPVFFLINKYQTKDTSIEGLKQAFDKFLDDVEASAKEKGIKISLYIMFPSFENGVNNEGFYEFYEYDREDVKALKPDFEDQADAFEAIFQALEGRSSIDRVTISGMWWDDLMDPEVKPRISISDTFRNKNAEAVIMKWGNAYKG